MVFFISLMNGKDGANRHVLVGETKKASAWFRFLQKESSNGICSVSPMYIVLYKVQVMEYAFLPGTFPLTWSLSPVRLTESAGISPNITCN